MAGGWGCEVVRWRDGDLHGLGYHLSNSLSREMFTTRVFECVRGDTLAGDSAFWEGKASGDYRTKARGSNVHEGDSKPAPLKDTRVRHPR